VTTAGGAKATTGPRGGTAAGGARATTVTTPGGRSGTTVSRAGGAVGPNGGAVAGGSRGGVATGPRGTAAGKRGGAVANFPTDGGLARHTSRAAVGGAAGAVRYSTRHVSGTHLRYQATAVRTGFVHHDCFRGRWYTNHPGCWRPARWAVAGAAWAVCTWAVLAPWCGVSTTPIVYDYGTTVVYEGDTVYLNGDAVASAEKYSEQAANLTEVGATSKLSKEEEWQPLGVFAIVRGDETTSDQIFQLAVNKDGVIRGNYYDALADSTQPVVGSVDKKTQRTAWRIGDSKTTSYEAGLSNLTNDQTTMLVHFGQKTTQQWALVRIKDKEADK
jgi:hypothetical protein